MKMEKRILNDYKIKVEGSISPGELKEATDGHLPTGANTHFMQGELSKGYMEAMEREIQAALHNHFMGAAVDVDIRRGNSIQARPREFQVHVVGGADKDRQAIKADIEGWLKSDYEPNRELVARALNEIVDRYPIRVEAADANEMLGMLSADSAVANVGSQVKDDSQKGYDVYLTVDQSCELLDLLERYSQNPLAPSDKCNELWDKLSAQVDEAGGPAAQEKDEYER
ncbi:MAG: hypothetical protein ACYC69_02890 [Thermodesulfovibrionales bacterium]